MLVFHNLCNLRASVHLVLAMPVVLIVLIFVSRLTVALTQIKHQIILYLQRILVFYAAENNFDSQFLKLCICSLVPTSFQYIPNIESNLGVVWGVHVQ